MKTKTVCIGWSLVLLAVSLSGAADATAPPAEKTLQVPGGFSITVRMQGPYDAETPLQVVCYFKHKPEGDKTQGAAVELDTRLGGLIAALRDRGEFVGERFETLLLAPPPGTIKAKQLLLIGLGPEAELSLETMQGVGRTALRTAAALGVSQVAFAPILRDQGNSALNTGDVENAVTRGVLLAHHTQTRLAEQKLAAPCKVNSWIVEAGPQYYDDTIAGVGKAIDQSQTAIKNRTSAPYTKR